MVNIQGWTADKQYQHYEPYIAHSKAMLKAAVKVNKGKLNSPDYSVIVDRENSCFIMVAEIKNRTPLKCTVSFPIFAGTMEEVLDIVKRILEMFCGEMEDYTKLPEDKD